MQRLHPHPTKSALAALLLLVLATGCATAPVAAPQTAPPPPPATADATPEMSSALHWARTAAEHRAIFLQTYRQAAAELERLVEGRQPFTWAVSVDADETLIDNSQYQKEREARGLGFTSESWNEWVRRQQATALPGAREFLETVRGLGGHVAVVTNRDEAVCGPTAANLRNLRLAFDMVLCKPAVGSSEKEPRWRAVQQGTASEYLPPLEIVMWLGDNIGDFPDATQSLADAPEDRLSPFGRTWWVFPNPMYGSWERVPPK